jgi:hypothetical protein
MRLATVPMLPLSWIVIDEDGPWIVPNIPGGLARRTPYRGNQTPVDVPPAEARLMLATLGEAIVGVPEIAERAGTTPGTVRTWRSRHADFPEPIATLAAGPVWAWSDVARWIAVPRRPGRPAKP